MKKTMSTILMVALAVLTVGAGTKVANKYDLSPGQKVDIDLKTGGSIQIQGWDEGYALLEYQMRGNDDDMVLRAESSADGLEIHCAPKIKSLRSSFGIDIHLKVPRLTDVKIYTSGGELKLEGLEGEFTGKTMGGEITLSHLTGRAELVTLGGNVLVTDSELDGRVKTMGGNIRFANIVGNIDGKTMGGNVNYDNVRLTKDSAGSGAAEDEVEISTMGGNINIEDAPYGARVKTMGGNIHVASAGEFVKAKTMGGRIVIDAIDGWVDATTMGGDVKVTMTGDPASGKRDVTIGSMGGDITLIVPEGLSMQFEIELEYTKNSKQNYKIESDFPLDIDESSDWSYFKGTPRKTIKGTGKVKDGKAVIKIHTINGDILIKRG